MTFCDSWVICMPIPLPLSRYFQRQTRSRMCYLFCRVRGAERTVARSIHTDASSPRCELPHYKDSFPALLYTLVSAKSVEYTYSVR